MVSMQQGTVKLPKGFGFADLIAPFTVEDFLKTYWQKKPCYVRGSDGKFRDLFSWEDLNHLLETHHFAHPRLRLSKGGVGLPAKEYLESLRFTNGTQVNSVALEREFSAGASLLLQHADEFHPRLQCLAEALATALGWHAEVEVIAGLGSSNALPVHHDANDCLVFQIQGTKRWCLYEPTRRAPLLPSKIFPGRYDVLPATKPDSKKPTHSFEVSAGDFLYIPRGWWHYVEPVPGACLSLNPTVYTATIQDLLRWLVNELSAEEVCRLAIPTDVSEQESVFARVASVLPQFLAPDSVCAFRRFMVNEMEAKPSISLPGAREDTQRISPASCVMMDRGQPVYLASDKTSPVFRVRWRGHDFHFDCQHLEMFRGLNDGQAHQVSDLLAACSSAEARIGAMAFLANLRKEGIITSARS